jgi:hypothetical protein
MQKYIVQWKVSEVCCHGKGKKLKLLYFSNTLIRNLSVLFPTAHINSYPLIIHHSSYLCTEWEFLLQDPFEGLHLKSDPSRISAFRGKMSAKFYSNGCSAHQGPKKSCSWKGTQEPPLGLESGLSLPY